MIEKDIDMNIENDDEFDIDYLRSYGITIEYAK